MNKNKKDTKKSDEKEEEEEKIEIPLKVKESKIEKSGVARIHDDVLAKLGIEEGKDVEVSYEDETVLVAIYADKLIGINEISLRKHERQRLDVKSGDEVIVSPHETIRKRFQEFGERIKTYISSEDEEEEEEEGSKK